MEKMRKQQGGFTLLELLIVVSILVMVGGTLLQTFGNNEENAAQGTATNSIARLNAATALYGALNSEAPLPNGLESLACAPSADAADLSGVTVNNAPSANGTVAATSTEAYKLGGESNLVAGGGLGLKVAAKFDLAQVNVSALSDSGVTNIRYAETDACDGATDTDPVDMAATAGYAATISGTLGDVNIPNHIFEEPRAGSNRNRGRGFAATVTDGSTMPLMVWKRGDGGYNNVKVGGQATDVLVGLGIGDASTMVGVEEINGIVPTLQKAPYYGQIARDKYSHYIALVKVGTDADGDLSSGFSASSKAVIVSIVDARGDFYAEELAEYTDQKT